MPFKAGRHSSGRITGGRPQEDLALHNGRGRQIGPVFCGDRVHSCRPRSFAVGTAALTAGTVVATQEISRLQH
jgi:hypothetical protein